MTRTSQDCRYLMHVDVRWPMQRPHFIAAQIAKDFQTTVYYRPAMGRQTLPPAALDLPSRPLAPFPESRLRRSSSVAAAHWMQRSLMLFRGTAPPSVVWLTYPTLAEYIPRRWWGSSVIVYDCMDDHQAMAHSTHHVRRLRDAEEFLVSEANLVIASHPRLASRLERLARREILTVRNGLSADLADRLLRLPSPEARWPPLAVYVGTIGPWIDWAVVDAWLQRFPELRVRFVGPVRGPVPHHVRLEFRAPVAHSHVPDELARADILIMPFLVDSVTKSVDPVKLYEYVAAGRPIVAARLPDSGAFEKYCDFYSGTNDAGDAMSRALNGDWSHRVRLPERRNFVERSTWAVRYRPIRRALEAETA